MTEFLEDREFIPWNTNKVKKIKCKKVFIGNGNNALEVIASESNSFPTKNDLKRMWKERKGRRANPLLLVNLFNNKAAICGISGDNPKVVRDIDIEQIERISRIALDKPDRHSAYRFLKDRLRKLDSDLMGIINQGLLSTHELKVGVPERPDWNDAKNNALNLLNKEGKELMKELGFELERDDRNTYILKDNNKNTAVAVFLEEGTSFEQPQETFNSKSPVNWALKSADEKRLPYVIANSGKTLRLYSTDVESGFGSRGRSDTFVEINIDLLNEDNCGYLWLLFSSQALQDNGTLDEIIKDSKDYATSLGERLKERIYDEVIPNLAEGIADARNLVNPDKSDLDTTYRMALLVLFRLLFIAYGEDEGFLPYSVNTRYTDHSLKKKVHDLEEFIQKDINFDANSTTHWNEINKLVEAIHNGNKEWGLPKYNGRLLSSDPNISPEGAIISQLELTNDCFGPILIDLLIDETEDGYKGAIDFRNLGVREFGVIYEGLLESELSVADRDLKVDENDRYIPTENEDEILVESGEIYLHNVSGERKATGTYYTKSIFVEHLLEYSLEPALEDHLNKLDNLSREEAEREFFNFRVADIAMGSGHFLIGAIDKIEKEFSKYLADNNLPEVEMELDRLKEVSKKAFSNQEDAPEVDDSQLLRRQIARRCIYGVDLNKTAVDLARLSIWVHTFVPGLPLTFLNHNLVTGDSLAGIGTLEEAAELIEEEKQNLFSRFSNNQQHIRKIKDKVNKLGELADANAKEVSQARKLQKELQNELEDYKKLFDILSASRLVDNIDPTALFNKIDNLGEIEDLREYKVAKEKLEKLDLLHFPLKFPEVFQNENEGGFNVIVGNPPWEEEMLDEDNFWKRYKPGLKGKTQREKEKIISRLKKERLDLKKIYNKELEKKRLRREILINGPYKGMGQGDADTYKAFYWRFWNLVNKQGYIGAVLPRSVFIAAGSKKFRNTLLENANIRDIIFLKNKKRWVFDMEPRYTIVLVSFKKMFDKNQDTIPLKGPFSDKKSFMESKNKSPFKFSIEQAKNWTKTSSFPVLPANPESVEVFKKMAEFPSLDYNSPKEWRVRPHTELHATNDKKKDDGTILMHFTEEPPEKDYLPIYKGNSFNLWNPDTGVRYAWANPGVIIDYLQEKRENSYLYAGSRSAFCEMDEKWVYDQKTLPCFKPRIAFRNVTNRTNRRTLIISIIPPNTILTNAAPYFLWPRGNENDQAYLLGIMSSIPFDWYARRFVETNVNYHLINAFPVPRPGKKSKIRKRIVELSGRLAAVDERFKDWANKVGVDYGPLDETKKSEYIYELDALVAHLYGLNKSNVKVIFQTFHIGWNYKPRLNKVLDYYQKWEDRI